MNNSEINVDVEIAEFSVIQLKTWLAALEQPTTGTKAELVARLNAISPQTRGARPNSTTEDPDASGHNSDMDEQSVISSQNEAVDNLNQQAQDTVGDTPTTSNADIHNHDVSVLEQLRGIQQMLAELKSPKGEEHHTTNGDKSGNGSDNIEKRAIFDINAKQQRSDSAALALSQAKEIAMSYDGTTCARLWAAQIQNIANMYNLDNGNMRILIISKLKGSAQQWLHANTVRIMEPIDAILEQLIFAFGDQQSKMELRRKFEDRKWQPGEKFAAYFEIKMMLANAIAIEPDELIEHIIEGIPDINLRDQAHIQRFSSPVQILCAFANVHIRGRTAAPKQRAPSTGNAVRRAGVRCTNCNSIGHNAQECRKPKREPGSCYACGKFGHFVAQCQDKNELRGNNYHAL
ncbi:uncharacterized protein LOC108604409 [Drosophila busckii]|uniref:uncharacterized protein LOC108604409 n=3 Tax=Drosophila busckii TaxID=30019 RepID=UPI001432A75F|nr:uncharacterized protein LOC108604409 [Drosophila busckii]